MGKDNSHRLCETDAWVKREWEQLPREEQKFWKKENEESHQRLIDFAQNQVLTKLGPQECAE